MSSQDCSGTQSENKIVNICFKTSHVARINTLYFDMMMMVDGQSVARDKSNPAAGMNRNDDMIPCNP